MQRYRLRDKENLRECMANSRRAVEFVPHSVRSLAAEVGTSHGTIGHLLTGEQQTVSEEMGRRVSEVLGAEFDELFVLEVSTSIDVDTSTEQEIRPNE